MAVPKTGSNTNTIKKDNIRLLYRHLRTGPLSCIDLSKRTGLTKSAVTTLTKELLCAGALRKTGIAKTAHGRPPVLLEIVRDYRFAIGLSFHREYIAAGVINLGFETIDSRRRPLSDFASPKEAADWAYRTGRQLVDRIGIPDEKILGIGVAAPGPLDCRSGVILNPPNCPLFQNFPLADTLKQQTDLPVFVHNVATLMALKEESLHSDKGENFALILIDAGVGSAVITDGKLYEGNAGFAGEIGHLSIDYHGHRCPCGNRGCLETYITEKSIRKHFGLACYPQTVDAAYAGDAKADTVLDRIAEYLGCAIVSLINVLDIESVYLSGELNYRHERLFSKIETYVHTHCFHAHAHHVKIRPSAVDAGSLSHSCSVILQKYFNRELPEADLS